MGESANVEHQLIGDRPYCVTVQPSKAVAEERKWSDVMAKVIEFYIRDPVPKKVNPVPIEQRGKLVEFHKEKFGAQSKAEDITERGEVRPPTVVFFGCF